MAVGKQLSIPELAAHISYGRTTLGGLGEKMVAQALELSGYFVDIPHEYQRGDLTAITPEGEILHIEVKTARKAIDGNYRFTLFKMVKGKVTATHTNTDFVIFLCVSKAGAITPYVVPTEKVGERRSAAISSNVNRYKGWLADYRQTIKKLRLQ